MSNAGFKTIAMAPARIEGAKKLSGAAAATGLAMVQRGEVGFAVGPSLISYGGSALLASAISQVLFPQDGSNGEMETLAMHAAINSAAVYALFALSGAPDIMTALAIGGGCVLGEYAYMKIIEGSAAGGYY